MLIGYVLPLLPLRVNKPLAYTRPVACVLRVPGFTPINIDSEKATFRTRLHTTKTYVTQKNDESNGQFYFRDIYLELSASQILVVPNVIITNLNDPILQG